MVECVQPAKDEGMAARRGRVDAPRAGGICDDPHIGKFRFRSHARHVDV